MLKEFNSNHNNIHINKIENQTKQSKQNTKGINYIQLHIYIYIYIRTYFFFIKLFFFLSDFGKLYTIF